MSARGWVDACLTAITFSVFSLSHANRIEVCPSRISQYSTPIIEIPIIPPMLVQRDVEKAMRTYASAGRPNPSVSQLFQRTVKNFSFVIIALLHAFDCTDAPAANL